MPNGTSQALTRFVPLAKGQTYAGSLEKAAGTTIRAAKAGAGASAGAHAKAKTIGRTGCPLGEPRTIRTKFSILDSTAEAGSPRRRAAASNAARPMT